MADPFIGEIRAFGFSFAPYQWAFCDGGTLSIQQYSALFAVIGTKFGGNGTQNFKLPDFRSRAPMHWGSGTGLTSTVIGQVQGTDTVTLTESQIPSHAHMLMGATVTPVTFKVATPQANAMFSNANPGQAYTAAVAATPLVAMSPKAIGISGGDQPHSNIQPRLSLNFCIALYGMFPARN